MSDVLEEIKAETQPSQIWLERREQLISKYQTALSKYLIDRRETRKKAT